MFARYPFWLHLWLHRTLHGGHHRRATVAGQPGSGFSCSHFKYKNPMRSERIGFFVEKTSIPLWLGTTTAPSEFRDLDCRANFAIWIAERISLSGFSILHVFVDVDLTVAVLIHVCKLSAFRPFVRRQEAVLVFISLVDATFRKSKIRIRASSR